MPEIANGMLGIQCYQFIGLNERIKSYSKTIEQHALVNADARRLMRMPGIGPITASAIVATIGDAKQFRTGRDMAAWLGLTPLNKFSGGKPNPVSTKPAAGHFNLEPKGPPMTETNMRLIELLQKHDEGDFLHAALERYARSQFQRELNCCKYRMLTVNPVSCFTEHKAWQLEARLEETEDRLAASKARADAAQKRADEALARVVGLLEGPKRSWWSRLVGEG